MYLLLLNAQVYLFLHHFSEALTCGVKHPFCRIQWWDNRAGWWTPIRTDYTRGPTQSKQQHCPGGANPWKWFRVGIRESLSAQLPLALMNKYPMWASDFEHLILTAGFHSTDLWCSIAEAWITGCLENQQARKADKQEGWYKLNFLRGPGAIQWRETWSSVRETEQQSKGVRSCCWNIPLWGRKFCLLQMTSVCSDDKKVSPKWKVTRWIKGFFDKAEVEYFNSSNDQVLQVFPELYYQQVLLSLDSEHVTVSGKSFYFSQHVAARTLFQTVNIFWVKLMDRQEFRNISDKLLLHNQRIWKDWFSIEKYDGVVGIFWARYRSKINIYFWISLEKYLSSCSCSAVLNIGRKFYKIST